LRPQHARDVELVLGIVARDPGLFDVGLRLRESRAGLLDLGPNERRIEARQHLAPMHDRVEVGVEFGDGPRDLASYEDRLAGVQGAVGFNGSDDGAQRDGLGADRRRCVLPAPRVSGVDEEHHQTGCQARCERVPSHEPPPSTFGGHRTALEAVARRIHHEV